MAALATALAAFGGTLTGALAVSSVPANAGTNGNTFYELDCAGAGLAAGQTAPFVVGLNLNGTPDPVFPSGAHFGATGGASVTVIGPVVAGLVQALNPATLNLGASSFNIASPNASATGSFSFSDASFGAMAPNGRQVTGVNIPFPVGNTIGPGFTAADVGDFVAGPTGDIAAGTTITSVTGGTATLSANTTNAAAVTGAVIGLGGPAGNTFVMSGLSIPTSTFSTVGTNGGKSSIGLFGQTAATSVTLITPAVSVTFGGAAATPCNQTGFTSTGVASTPAPVFTNAQYTAAGIAPLVSVTPFQPAAAAFVSLVVNPPVANNQSVTIGTHGTKTLALAAAPGSNPTAPTPPSVASCANTAPDNTRLTVTVSNTPTPCQVTIADSPTATGTATVHFTYTATDNSPATIGGPFTSAAATVTVTIGTPPVDQQINQQVNGGQLVVSCNAPGSTGYPLLTCPLITLPAITLNGQSQTTTAPANTIFVSDNRGDPTVGWTLTTFMVTTPGNPNPTCAAATDFCNSTIGTAASNPNGHIASANLNLSSIVCAVAAGNTNPAPTTGTGGGFGPPAPALTLCTATAGQSGGTFTMDGTFKLSIPPTVFAGLYMGTVEYLVA
jgi:hypothetical protein